MTRRKRDSNPGPSALEADALTTRPMRRWGSRNKSLLITSDPGPGGILAPKARELLISLLAYTEL